MRNSVRLTENQLHNIIKESVKRVLNERRGLQSQKLYDIFKEYGKPTFPYKWHFSDMKDEDIIGFVDYNDVDSTIKRINSKERKEYGLNRGDEACYLEFIKDNKRYFLVYIDRNAKLSRGDLENAKGGFADFWKKTEERKLNRNSEKHGWHKYFYSPTEKGAAAREMRTDNSPWNVKNAEKMGYDAYRKSKDYDRETARLAFHPQKDDIGWTSQNRQQRMNDIRNMPKGQKRF